MSNIPNSNTKNTSHNNTISQYVIVNDAEKAIKFYQDVFKAKEFFRLEHEDNGQKLVDHCELLIGNSILMLSDERSMHTKTNYIRTGNYPVTLGIYVKDVDQSVDMAVKYGSKIDEPIVNTYWGDRMGSIIDPFGIKWGISTRIEDITYEEIARRHQMYIEKFKTTQQGGMDQYREKYLKYKKKYLDTKNNR